MLAVFWPVRITRCIKKVFLDRLHLRTTRIFFLCLARHVVLLCSHFIPPLLNGFKVRLNKCTFLGISLLILHNGIDFRFLICIQVVLPCKLILKSLRSTCSKHRLCIVLEWWLILIDWTISQLIQLILIFKRCFIEFRLVRFLMCCLRRNWRLHLIQIEYFLGVFTDEHFNFAFDLGNFFIRHIEVILHFLKLSGNLLWIILFQIINEVDLVVAAIHFKFEEELQEFLLPAHFLLRALTLLLARLLWLARLLHIWAPEHRLLKILRHRHLNRLLVWTTILC